MTERNVDVMDKTGKVLHTYPITLGATDALTEGCRLREGGTERREGGEAGSRIRFCQPEDTDAHGRKSRRVI